MGIAMLCVESRIERPAKMTVRTGETHLVKRGNDTYEKSMAAQLLQKGFS
jgi:hypothetical protein